MASRFEETANLMKKLSQKGFTLKLQNNQLIIHSDPKVFDEWGFIGEEIFAALFNSDDEGPLDI